MPTAKYHLAAVALNQTRHRYIPHIYTPISILEKFCQVPVTTGTPFYTDHVSEFPEWTWECPRYTLPGFLNKYCADIHFPFHVPTYSMVRVLRLTTAIFNWINQPVGPTMTDGTAITKLRRKTRGCYCSCCNSWWWAWGCPKHVELNLNDK